MLSAVLYRCGFRAWQMQIFSLSAIGLCIGLWIRAKTVDQDERGNAERRARLSPTLCLIGDSLARREAVRGPVWTRVLRRRLMF